MAQSAVQKALFCQDILLEIFEYFDPGRPNPDAPPRERARRRIAQRTLARLARVCHTFSAPALNVLWRVVDDVIALLSILPSKVLRSPNPTDQQWERFQRYACRVRELYTNLQESKPSVSINPLTWAFFQGRLRHGQVLLPRLVRLEDFNITAAGDTGWLMFLSPTLRHMTVRVHHPSQCGHTGDGILEVARMTTVPHLNSLRILPYESYGSMHNPRQETFPYAQLSHLQELEILQMIIVDKTLVTALLAFPALRRLELTMKLMLPDAESKLPTGFHALRYLRITGMLDHLSRFLVATSPMHLELLGLNPIDWSDAPDAPDAMENAITHMESVLEHLEHAKTPRFELKFDSLFTSFPSISDGFASAISFDYLTHVVIKIPDFEFDVSDADIAALTSGWTNLVEFELSMEDPMLAWSYPMSSEPDLPSGKTLVRFAQRHPRLVRLRLPFIALPNTPHWSWSEIWHSLSDFPACGHGLRELRVDMMDDAPLPLFRALAMLVDRLFPNLDLADVHYPDRSPHDEEFMNWCEVEQMLLALRIGRTGAHRTAPLGDTPEAWLSAWEPSG